MSERGRTQAGDGPASRLFMSHFFYGHIVVKQFPCGNGFSSPKQIAFYVVEWDGRLPL